jgi:hypothetical protein
VSSGRRSPGAVALLRSHAEHVHPVLPAGDRGAALRLSLSATFAGGRSGDRGNLQLPIGAPTLTGWDGSYATARLRHLAGARRARSARARRTSSAPAERKPVARRYAIKSRRGRDSAQRLHRTSGRR